MTTPDDHSASAFDDFDPQWSEQSRARYLAGVDDLVEELRRHARLVAGLDQEHFHHDPDTRRTFLTSQDLLDRALGRAAAAEADWIGTTSLPFVELEAEEDLDSLDELDDLEDDLEGAGEIVSLVGRWDLEILDEQAFLEAGRAAYARLHSLADPSLAEANVTDPLQAAAALLESPAFPELEVDGASAPLGAFWTYVQHTEPLSEADGLGRSDPFDIARDDEEG